jgi:hypothetical protein
MLRRVALTGVMMKPFTSRQYVSIPDIIFGEDDISDEDLANHKKHKNPYVARKINGKFFGPWSKESNKKLRDVIRLMLSPNNPRFKIPKNFENKELLKPANVDLAKLADTSTPHVTWLGHASCYYQVDGTYFMTDPVFGERASPLSFMGPKRFYDPPMKIEDLKLDVVVLSHTHYDHLDEETVRKIGNRAYW